MENSIKIEYAEIHMRCPFSKQTETVYIRYMSNGIDLMRTEIQGCDKHYHDCKQCTICLEKAGKQFKDSFPNI